eukprot:88436_1
MSNTVFRSFRPIVNSQFAATIKDISDNCWVSDANDQFNEIYNALGSSLQSKIKTKNVSQSQFQTLYNLRKYTTINLQSQLDQIQLFQPHIKNPSTFKTQLLSKLPVLTFKLPIFNKLKP